MRIKNSNNDLNKAKLNEFFRQRATKYTPNNPLVSVLYQDNNPDLALMRHLNEIKRISPLLGLGKNSRVLDIGCGVGRWAEELNQLVKLVVGTDFNSEFISIAQNRFRKVPNVAFYHLSAGDTTFEKIGQQFDVVIIAGLFLYLNDNEVTEVLNNLLKLLPSGRLFLREPIGVEYRLTLIDEWSEDLQTNYSAIYRTKSEMEELIWNSEVGQKLSLVESNWISDETLVNRVETRQKYWIWNVGQ